MCQKIISTVSDSDSFRCITLFWFKYEQYWMLKIHISVFLLQDPDGTVCLHSGQSLEELLIAYNSIPIEEVQLSVWRWQCSVYLIFVPWSIHCLRAAWQLSARVTWYDTIHKSCIAFMVVMVLKPGLKVQHKPPRLCRGSDFLNHNYSLTWINDFCFSSVISIPHQ